MIFLNFHLKEIFLAKKRPLGTSIFTSSRFLRAEDRIEKLRAQDKYIFKI